MGNGRRVRESANTNDWQEAQRKLRERLHEGTTRSLTSSGKENNCNSRTGWIFFWKTIPSPQSAAKRPTQQNERAGRHLKEAFGGRSVREITADDIEIYLRRRLDARVQIKTRAGVAQKDRLKPATVHQELRVLRLMLNVAVRKKLLRKPFRRGRVPGESERDVPA